MTSIVIFILATFFIFSSIRLFFFSTETEMGNKIINIISHPGWLILVIIFLPVFVGFFYRGEWEFSWTFFWIELTGNNSLSTKILLVYGMIIVTLWLFILPAHIFLRNNSMKDFHTQFFIRGLNIIFALYCTESRYFLIFGNKEYLNFLFTTIVYIYFFTLKIKDDSP